jgi:glyoxylase-like metal-dependent hydrolase (beta-lactamase superfamily II)
MFGVVPKLFGTKPIQPMPTTSLTSTLFIIEDGNQLILIDTGMGTNSLKNFMGYSRFGTHR